MATTLSKAAPHTAVAHGLASTSHPRIRKPSKAPPPPTLPQIGPSNDIHLQPMAEELQVAFQKEIEAKEQLYVQVHERDQQVLGLNDQVLQLRNSIATAEKQLLDAYNEQSRMEEELCGHQAITEKLREQLKEAEREKRDLSRRYQEQVKSFEAERQSFYDNEQHLKSRIRSLTQAQTRRRSSRRSFDRIDPQEGTEMEAGEEIPELGLDGNEEKRSTETSEHTEDDDPPEVASLKVELSTLSTSYTSLQNTVQHLQAQVGDLQRVNNQLQDENESYNILLLERTMSGQFDVRKQLPASGTDPEDDSERNADGRSIRSAARSTLGRVSELDELEAADEESQQGTLDYDPFHERSPSGASKAHARSGASSPTPQGESLAGLPLTGPGLDLAAELGRAENKEVVDSTLSDSGNSPAKVKNRRGARMESLPRGDEVNTLRSEVKSLKDANKALSLYASKILDRIIAQEGFEHVLAVDYKEQASSPPEQASSPPKKPRPQSAMFSLGSSFTMSSKSGSSVSKETSSTSISTPPASAPSSEETKRQRRSMSFDWRSLSSWGSGDKKPEHKNLRPLTLRPGATPIVGAKKLDTEEDDDDRKERERLAATMKLMGIEPAPQSPQLARQTEPETRRGSSSEQQSTPTATNKRWSLFRSQPPPPLPPKDSTKLTEDALQHVEANESLKQLDERERMKMESISKGGGSGFTERNSRRSISDEWRSRRDARHGNGSTGSASTIWSAGLSNRDQRSAKNSIHGSP